MRRLFVYDTDGINPYGREVALLLAEAGWDPEIVLPVDTTWLPQRLRVRCLLPGNRQGRSKWVQAASLARALLHCMGRAARHPRAPWLVAWTRSRSDEMLFALLARLGVPVYVVVHNPGARDVLRPSQRLLRRWARGLLVHSEHLRVLLDSGRPRAAPIHAVTFPPYTGWWEEFGRVRRASTDLRLLLLGQRRPDKGLDAVPTILSHVAPEARARLRLRVCGKGSSPQAELHRLVSTTDDTTADFVADADLAAALADSDVLLAPYAGATQSATVALALTAGLAVIAYDDGALSELVPASGLVPSSDVEAFAEHIESSLVRRSEAVPAVGSLDVWHARALQQWSSALA